MDLTLINFLVVGGGVALMALVVYLGYLNGDFTE